MNLSLIHQVQNLWLKQVNKAIILVIRHENEPDKPYITVEYKNNKVQQWYGIRDTKPDKEIIDSFLKAYVAHIAGKAGKAG